MILPQSPQTGSAVSLFPPAATDFAAFWEKWSDYVLSLNEMDEESAEALYLGLLANIRQMADKPLWRGMSVATGWLDSWSQEPVGIFWSEDVSVAQMFQSAVSVYDERFVSLESLVRPNKVLLQARVPLDSIDVGATIAMQMASSEAEIRLVEGGSVQVLALHVNDKPVCCDARSAFA